MDEEEEGENLNECFSFTELRKKKGEIRMGRVSFNFGKNEGTGCVNPPSFVHKVQQQEEFEIADEVKNSLK